MSEFHKISGGQLLSEKESIKMNPFELIGTEWCLITAGPVQDYNTMTASWGTMGIFWGKPVVNSFIRPQRYTYEFMEKYDCFTLSFFLDPKYRPVLNFCGSKSGRDYDKVKECGLTVKDFDGAAGFEEADMVVACKKIYYYDLDEPHMLDASIMKHYAAKDFHRCYFGEILNVYEK